MARSGYDCRKAGGEDVVDRRLNGHTVQLKTPYWRGTVEGKSVSYRMHKTHGPETHPDALYLPNEFAEIFVGLHPKGGVIICPREKLSTRGQLNPKLPYPERISDPLPFDWNTPWFDRYDLLGIDREKLAFTEAPESKILPRMSKAVKYSDSEIIRAIMAPENFRVWVQLIVGSVREFHFLRFVEKNSFTLKEPADLDSRSREKVDYVYEPKRGKPLRIQVKGLTKGMCDGNILGVETQGSHSRPPARLYRRDDFEILVIVIDPNYIPVETAKRLGVKPDEYNFLFIKMADLPAYPKTNKFPGEFIQRTFSFDVRKYQLNNIELLDS